jgi:hypothetical protein
MMCSNSAGRSGLRRNGGGGVATKRQHAGCHFIEDCVEREQIGAGVRIPAQGLFWRHVRDSAEGASWTGKVLVSQGSGHAR